MLSEEFEDGRSSGRVAVTRRHGRSSGATPFLRLRPLELPRREASEVDVELVEPGIVTVAGELDLELHLVLRDGQPSDRAIGPDARPAPRAIRATDGELSALDSGSGFLPKRTFIGHLATPFNNEDKRQMPGSRTPGCVDREARWKACSAYHGRPTVGFLGGPPIYWAGGICGAKSLVVDKRNLL
jgi:hypothetical protein